MTNLMIMYLFLCYLLKIAGRNQTVENEGATGDSEILKGFNLIALHTDASTKC